MIVATQPKISLSLDASDTTIMHRVGMTGLYMTLKRLEQKFPDSRNRAGHLSWLLTPDTIELFWAGSDVVALSWLMQESFQLDDRGLIQLAGLENDAMELEQKIHIHEGICAIFLRHNKFYKAGNQAKTKLTVESQEVEYQYKPLLWYAHQTFAQHLCEINTQQLKQDYLQFTSWLYLGGVVRHAMLEKVTKLEAKPEYAFALLFVPVVCHYWLLHFPSEDLKERKPHRYLVVIPEVNNFEEASQRRWRLQQLAVKQLHVSSIEEAGLLYYSLDEVQQDDNYYQACQVWLYEKMNKMSHQRTVMSIKEIDIDKDILITYQVVQQQFQPNYQHINSKKNLITVNSIRSLIAENLVRGLPWWSNFWEKLIVEDSKGYLFKQLLYNRRGVKFMVEGSEQKEKCLTFVNVFQHAMSVYFAKVYAKTDKGKEAPIEKRVERLRAELNCCYDELSFQQYLADFLARGGLNEYFYENKDRVLLIIEEVSWKKLRVWSLLAIASYKPKEKHTNTNENSSPDTQKLEGVNDESE
ncbi:type I-MYXAN CRISPR-associated Cas8a1/Cmx1 [Chroococcus sp. FPU101]|uniref:type I-MYXAN CRISPR-associated Cas8a1/Cmx1 n=1 Tax=Chroococcus sp. FPU101 TaxID=1974212 RepID=UPI001A8E0C41|nr:type I-MYXAN CRISPR-associated Cas8a1/Cmx1 [Chroococcus sp. FPU101]GFE69218.1 hypothetical protein CFPU101_18280 [Chroococcus sp. FPU101]